MDGPLIERFNDAIFGRSRLNTIGEARRCPDKTNASVAWLFRLVYSAPGFLGRGVRDVQARRQVMRGNAIQAMRYFVLLAAARGCRDCEISRRRFRGMRPCNV